MANCFLKFFISSYILIAYFFNFYIFFQELQNLRLQSSDLTRQLGETVLERDQSIAEVARNSDQLHSMVDKTMALLRMTTSSSTMKIIKKKS